MAARQEFSPAARQIIVDNPLFSQELHTLAQEFIWNADNSFAGSSLFYEGLARRVAADPEILALAAHAQKHQPAPNLLFSAVHYLLLRDMDDPLALFYADLTRKPNTADDPYPVFRAFCLDYADEIIALVSTRRVQTNEVARCLFFLPAFTQISQMLNGEPFALIEVGSSAGLNLNWDRYAYDYGDGALLGDLASLVRLECELRGAGRPPLMEALPSVASRIGMDLHPNDVFDDDSMLWLLALTWPEQIVRARRLQNAIAIARAFPPTILQGNALELVPRVMAEIPQETPIVLFHSFVLNQLPVELRARYYEIVRENAAGRICFDVAVEPSAWPVPMILRTIRNGTETQQTLATCDHHGRWLEWIAS